MSSSSVEFSFDKETHTYQVPGHYVFGTSDVLALNGLCDYGSVPKQNLEYARVRGECVHKAIELFEKGTLDYDSIPEQFLPWFEAYMEFKVDTEFALLAEPEVPRVYQHEGTDLYVGVTPDWVGTMNGAPFVIDGKCTHPQSGQALKQALLRWQLQLQSQMESLVEDFGMLGRAILHLRKEPVHGKLYRLYFFEADDSAIWDSALRVAAAKRAAGYGVCR